MWDLRRILVANLPTNQAVCGVTKGVLVYGHNEVILYDVEAELTRFVSCAVVVSSLLRRCS